MAKGKYEYWLTEDGLLLLAAWARDGLTDEQIAAKMSVSVATLYNYKNKFFEILEALKRGKEPVDIEVENALLKRALGYSYTETTQERRQNEDGDYNLVTTKVVTKEVVPDTTAQIYWLKNRKRSEWQDRPVDMESGFSEINQNLQAIADILQNPAPNRELPTDE